MYTLVEPLERSAMEWEREYGPYDGPWLHATCTRITGGLDHLQSIRVTRLDDKMEMARDRDHANLGAAIFGEWEVTSDVTGDRYMITVQSARAATHFNGY
ncbi:MAG: hypothetical protein ACRDG4_17170 [Chloroflexota bacterium]